MKRARRVKAVRKGGSTGKPLKKIPEFRSEDEERDFWATKERDSTQYLDWSKARLARFPNIKLSTRWISLRLPLSLLERIKLEANKRDVPYQSLIKVWLAEKVGNPFNARRKN
jgi:predicted DNA binding CopG/RHH family protein